VKAETVKGTRSLSMPYASGALHWIGLLAASLLLVEAAAADSIEVSTEQMARLGVELARPERAADMEIASGPAEIAIPPSQEAVVSAPVAGLVSRLLVAVGETVAADQPVAEIRSAEFLDLQREYLDAAATNEIEQAQLARDRGLHDEGIIAARRLQEATVAASAAAIKLTQAEQQLRLAGVDRSGVERLARNRELAVSLMLRAPFAGVVVAQHVKIGEHVDALEAVLQVANLDELWLEIHLPQETAPRVELGMSALVDVEGETLTGAIITMGRIVDAATQTVLVRAAIDNASALLRAGQFLSARIVSRPVGVAVVSIPSGAVTRNGVDAFVFVRTPAGFDIQPIELLGDGGSRVYVQGAIGESAEVAVAGVSALKSLWMSAQDAGS